MLHLLLDQEIHLGLRQLIGFFPVHHGQRSDSPVLLFIPLRMRNHQFHCQYTTTPKHNFFFDTTL